MTHQIAAVSSIVLLAQMISHAQPAAETLSQANVAAIHVSDSSKPVSPDLIGIFFEDINYAADGGLYAELIQNRSFEYQPTEQLSWNPLTSWELVKRGDGKGSLAIEAADPVHPNNPHYAILEVSQPGDGVGLANSGFDGIVVRAGETCDVSLFAKQRYNGERWSGKSAEGNPAPLIARLESKSGEVLGEAVLGAPGWEWTHLTAQIIPTNTDAAARFVVLATAKGGVALDVISLFPQKTFRGRPNGMRPDLAQALADLKPKFIRFPGGCVAHGNGLPNMYRWKNTIGPIEQRKEQANLWGYHQSGGLGYFEYFQFCEDIGATALPVLPAAVCCQNSDHTGGAGQKGIPLDEMKDYVQEVLDLIEWANGPATSKWGARRAAAGHPEPFHLKYLGIGNEDRITPVFRERFQMIYKAVTKKHPEITVIGTVGPFPAGEDFDEGWKIADQLHVDMVDEHYYEKPEWFLKNLKRYDTYDRKKTKVYVGEYAAHDKDRANTLRSALAEAAYLTALERNADVVRLASYAPLLAKQGHTQWRPDMIYFDNTNILFSANYYVQQLFGQNSGDVCLATIVELPGVNQDQTSLTASCVREAKTGEIILKLVNVSAAPILAQIGFAGNWRFKPEASRTVLAGDPDAVNSFANPKTVVPVASKIAVGKSFGCEVPANSLTVMRLTAD